MNSISKLCATCPHSLPVFYMAALQLPPVVLVTFLVTAAAVFIICRHHLKTSITGTGGMKRRVALTVACTLYTGSIWLLAQYATQVEALLVNSVYATNRLHPATAPRPGSEHELNQQTAGKHHELKRYSFLTPDNIQSYMSFWQAGLQCMLQNRLLTELPTLCC